MTPLGPRALIFTVYGAFARHLDGWIAVADLIALMATLGVDEQAVRSAISRLKRRDALVPERRDGVAGYALSDWGREVVAAGDRRILLRQPPAHLADGWLLAVFSVPESERNQRHVLRSQLASLGFGSAAPGVWVAPSHLLEETRATLARLGLGKYVTLFRGEYLPLGNGAPDGPAAPADPRSAVAAWWYLDALQRTYAEFITDQSPVLRAWSARGGAPARGPTDDPGRMDDRAAFADYVRALTEWRRLPYLDPGLPVETLPATWNGERAADLFFGLRDLLADAALRHVHAVTNR